MTKYRKKPVEINAVQFITSPKVQKLAHWGTARTELSFEGLPVFVDEQGPFCMIKTDEGDMKLREGDWLITGVEGEKYPCRDSVFQQTYELVN